MIIRACALLIVSAILGACSRKPEAVPVGEVRSAEIVVATGVAPDWKSVADALESAEESGQPLMVFVYTDWCGWCQRTFGTTFRDKSVLSYLNENFQAVKLNAESNQQVNYKGRNLPEGLLAHLLGATGFPTFVFLNSEGVPVYRTSGYRAAEGYLELLKFIANRRYASQSFEEYLASS
jgi:thioredoxin-related protein